MRCPIEQRNSAATEGIATNPYGQLLRRHRPQSRWAGVCSLRLSASVPALERAFLEVGHLVSEAGQVLWNIGSSATPSTPADHLRGLGLREPDPPWTPCAPPWCWRTSPRTSMVPTCAVSRRWRSIGRGWRSCRPHTMAQCNSAAEDEPALAEETFERRNRRGCYH
ncbi:MAG: hypothetical protein WKF73_20050, partial [Nocardioidaceae bacterium]